MIHNDFTHCLLCHAPLNEQVTWKRLLTNHFSKTICSICESKFELFSSNEVDELLSLYKYNEAMKDYLHRYKFLHDVILSNVFRDKIYSNLSKRKEIIVPIPMHPFKLKERTFAHVDELLKAAKIPFQHFLEKITTETQMGKSREERINSPQIFKLLQNAEALNKDIILVDDIYTTGTTIAHAKTLLINAGAKSVKAFTLIRG